MTDLLSVDGLCVDFKRRGHGFDRVLSDVSFQIAAGETVALVGESGSGKTTIGKAVLGLLRPTEGSIHVDGRPLRIRSQRERRAWTGTMQAVFQDPFSSLNPTLRVGASIGEPLRATQTASAKDGRRIVDALIQRVGLPLDTADRFPAHFSGGQRQRIGIARALSVRPKLIVCDEPTSALDVSTQRRILDLLAELQRETGVGYLFITHDLATVREFADRAVVLRKGVVVEQGNAVDICDSPQHPYTQALVAAAPVPDPIIQRERRKARLDQLVSLSAE